MKATTFLIAGLLWPLLANVHFGKAHPTPGQATWKLHGPDLNGTYGGMQGVGGLEAVQTGYSQPVVLISDARGNVVQQYDTWTGSLTNSSSRPTGYGAAPGYEPAAMGYGVSFGEASAWRGKWKDITGYYWLGKRYYTPQSGSWLSYDSVWNIRDPNWFTFCGDDPINYFDPEGMYGKELNERARSIDINNPLDFLQAVGYGIGGTALQTLGSIPGAFSDARVSMAAANQEISTYSGGQAVLANSLRLMGNFSFGATTLINDPIDTFPQIPRGIFVDLPTSVAHNVGDFANNPSIYGAFNLIENGIQVAALAEGGAALYRGGVNLASSGSLARSSETPFQYYMRQAQTLNVSTSENGAVFWSGPGNRALAEQFAHQNGRFTLELTPGGSWLDQQQLFNAATSPLTPAEAIQVWQKFSQRFAAEASGTSVGFVNGARAASTFNTIEYPTLLNNPNVRNVITGGH